MKEFYKTKKNNSKTSKIKIYKQNLIFEVQKKNNNLKIYKMQKYLFIDTWNGQGYSESNAYVTFEKDQNEALAAAKREVNIQTCDNMHDEFTIEKTGKFENNICTESLGYSFDDGEDAGAICFEEFNEDTKGVIVIPNINSYEVITSKKRWKAVLNTVKNFSEDYKEEQQIYGTVHHCMNDGCDWILFEKSDFKQA